MSGFVVLGYDESASANAALAATIPLGGRVAERGRRRLRLLRQPARRARAGRHAPALEQIGEHALRRAVTDLEAAGVSATTVRRAPPRRRDPPGGGRSRARLIVVGTEGENPITGAFLGSVVLKLVQRSKHPLLVVPTTEA